MRKGVIWMGAIVGALLAAGGWVFEFALSKGAAFIYAVVVSLVANVVFDYVHEPEAPPPAKAATATIRPTGAAHPASAAERAKPAALPGSAASAEAALPAARSRHLPAIISPVPVHPLPPLAPPPTGVAARSQPAPATKTAAQPPAPPQQAALPSAAPPAAPGTTAPSSPTPQRTALAAPPPPPAASPLPPPAPAAPPAPSLTIPTPPAPARPPAPGPGSGGLY